MKIECPQCKGKGKYSGYAGDAFVQDVLVYYSCQNCNGYGQLLVDEKTGVVTRLYEVKKVVNG